MPDTQVRTTRTERSPPFQLSTSSPFLQSQEKIDLLRMLGAEVYPVPAVAYENPKNYNHQAKAFAESLPNAVWTDQFDNVANARAHYETTGPEIWEQTQGTLDAFTCATGTGGTLAGVGRFLKEKSGGRTQVWLADPPGSVLHSYVQTGGKLKERSGGSITEGCSLSSSLEPSTRLNGLGSKVSARGASLTISERSSPTSTGPCTSRTKSRLRWCTTSSTPKACISVLARR